MNVEKLKDMIATNRVVVVLLVIGVIVLVVALSMSCSNAGRDNAQTSAASAENVVDLDSSADSVEMRKMRSWVYSQPADGADREQAAKYGNTYVDMYRDGRVEITDRGEVVHTGSWKRVDDTSFELTLDGVGKPWTMSVISRQTKTVTVEDPNEGGMGKATFVLNDKARNARGTSDNVVEDTDGQSAEEVVEPESSSEGSETSSPR